MGWVSGKHNYVRGMVGVGVCLKGDDGRGGEW